MPSVVTENLKLHVMRVFDEFFNVDAGIAKRLLGLGASGMESLDQGDVVVRDTHAAASTASDRFDHDGIADTFGNTQCILLIFYYPFRSWWCRYTGFFCQRPANRFILKRIHST